MPPVPEGCGWLEVICGPMFSGKSDELLRRMRRAEVANRKIVLLQPRVDTRHAGEVRSHDGLSRPAISVYAPAEILAHARDAEVVGIDEAQFLDESLGAIVEQLVTEGKRVVVAGLDRDFRGEPFGPMPALLARAEMVDKLHAVCHECGRQATLSQRLVNGKPAPLTDVTVLVGGHERYEARCRACFQAG
jgi:thymidine kinase